MIHWLVRCLEELGRERNESLMSLYSNVLGNIIHYKTTVNKDATSSTMLTSGRHDNSMLMITKMMQREGNVFVNHNVHTFFLKLIEYGESNSLEKPAWYAEYANDFEVSAERLIAGHLEKSGAGENQQDDQDLSRLGEENPISTTSHVLGTSQGGDVDVRINTGPQQGTVIINKRDTRTDKSGEQVQEEEDEYSIKMNNNWLQIEKQAELASKAKRLVGTFWPILIDSPGADSFNHLSQFLMVAERVLISLHSFDKYSFYQKTPEAVAANIGCAFFGSEGKISVLGKTLIDINPWNKKSISTFGPIPISFSKWVDYLMDGFYCEFVQQYTHTTAPTNSVTPQLIEECREEMQRFECLYNMLIEQKFAKETHLPQIAHVIRQIQKKSAPFKKLFECLFQFVCIPFHYVLCYFSLNFW